MPPTRLLLLTLLLVPGSAAAKEAEQDPWQSFVPGKFALVGQWPDGGSPYTGEAKIEVRGKGFTMHRTVGGKTLEAEGKIEVPSPPGEGKVLRFRWRDSDGARVMTCLVSGDLDNYARLSCVWVIEGKEHQAPGLEAYFSSESWSGG